jgi:hypothetical protein
MNPKVMLVHVLALLLLVISADAKYLPNLLRWAFMVFATVAFALAAFVARREGLP